MLVEFLILNYLKSRWNQVFSIFHSTCKIVISMQVFFQYNIELLKMCFFLCRLRKLRILGS